jgi:putative acetyltransferase
MLVRDETGEEAPTVFTIHEAAFPTDAEARLVDALRASGNLSVSLVATVGSAIIGHIAFSPVEIQTSSSPSKGLGLAPVAVAPAYQRQGVGSAMIRAGLERCKEMQARYVVVLGEPAYYQRFGFRAAHLRGIRNEYQAQEEFMIMELVPGGIPGGGGLARYCKEFSLVG